MVAAGRYRRGPPAHLARRVRGGGTLEIRMEAFNLTNALRWRNPGGESGTATFGRVTSTVPASERMVTFGGRF